MIMEKLPYSNHPARVIISGPSECEKSFFRNKFNFKFY